jgi:hypothetical protein
MALQEQKTDKFTGTVMFLLRALMPPLLLYGIILFLSHYARN